MDDHKDKLQPEAERREDSVLEQRYKELYGTGDPLPPEDTDAADAPEASPEEASSSTPAPASRKDAAKGDSLPEKRVSRRVDASARTKRPAWDEEEDTLPPRSSLTGAPAKKAKQPAQHKPAPEPEGRRSGSGRRVDTLERSQARRSYGQPPKPQMKLWPWLLAGGILVLALVGLLVYSLLRPLPGRPAGQATPAPTGIPVNIIGQPTLGPTTDLSAIIPATPNPTVEPTPVPGTPTPDTSTILRPGTSGSSVRQLQQRLIELGYMATGTDDGDYGNTTQSAVVAFQKAHNLTADGYAGSQTLTLLYSPEALAAPTATPKP